MISELCKTKTEIAEFVQGSEELLNSKQYWEMVGEKDVVREKGKKEKLEKDEFPDNIEILDNDVSSADSDSEDDTSGTISEVPSDESSEEESEEDSNHLATQPRNNNSFQKHASITALLSSYDPSKRQPEYSGAEHCPCFWELKVLCNHYHPSVRVWAQSLTNLSPIVYDGNPLEDMNLISFLDRFSYRNPKKKQRRADSTMTPRQPLRRSTLEPVNSSGFISRPKQQVREDELFYYKYFKQQEQRGDKPKKKQKRETTMKESDIDRAVNSEQKNFMKSVLSAATQIEEPSEYSYDDLDDALLMADDDKEVEMDLEGQTDAFYENLLLQEMEEEEDDDDDTTNLKDFANVEEFAHLLETSSQDYAGINAKQIAWELKHDGKQKKSKLKPKTTTKKRKR